MQNFFSFRPSLRNTLAKKAGLLSGAIFLVSTLGCSGAGDGFGLNSQTLSSLLTANGDSDIDQEPAPDLPADSGNEEQEDSDSNSEDNADNDGDGDGDGDNDGDDPTDDIHENEGEVEAQGHCDDLWIMLDATDNEEELAIIYDEIENCYEEEVVEDPCEELALDFMASLDQDVLAEVEGCYEAYDENQAAIEDPCQELVIALEESQDDAEIDALLEEVELCYDEALAVGADDFCAELVDLLLDDADYLRLEEVQLCYDENYDEDQEDINEDEFVDHDECPDTNEGVCFLVEIETENGEIELVEICEGDDFDHGDFGDEDFNDENFNDEDINDEDFNDEDFNDEGSSNEGSDDEDAAGNERP